MGQFADEVGRYLCTGLAAARPALDWQTEYHIAGTPVDVAGVGDDRLVCVELEWRRADPADNTAKLFRHLAQGTIDGAVHVFQLFTGYYDLAAGGVSSKRQNAEFVGRVASETLAGFSYTAVDVPFEPPKRGVARPDGWETAVETALLAICERLSQ